MVVFDCNVYLDAAFLVGEPFSWEQLDNKIIEVSKGVSGRAPYSIAAIAVCTSGRFAGDESLEVWTSPHINATVRFKAQEPVSAVGSSGLGWQSLSAASLVDDLICELVSRSCGLVAPDAYPEGDPPLDHEDGKVFGTCKWISADDPLANVYCVTNDGDFITAYENGELGGHTRVLRPSRFVSLVKAARIAKTRRPPPPTTSPPTA